MINKIPQIYYTTKEKIIIELKATSLMTTNKTNQSINKLTEIRGNS